MPLVEMLKYIIWSSLILYPGITEASVCEFATNYIQYDRCINQIHLQCSYICAQDRDRVLCNQCEVNTVQNLECTAGSYRSGNFCVPASSLICPANTAYSNGFCVQKTEIQCPSSYAYTNGICLNQKAASISIPNCQTIAGTVNCPVQTQCPQNNVLVNGGCVTPIVATCAQGFTQQSGYCIRQNTCPTLPCPATQCPLSSSMVNGFCVRQTQCPANQYNISGICASCPEKSRYVNGTCEKCPPGTFYLNGECHKNIICSDSEISIAGVCMGKYCFGPSYCCNTSECNFCFKRCQDNTNVTRALSLCHEQCMNGLIPTIFKTILPTIYNSWTPTPTPFIPTPIITVTTLPVTLPPVNISYINPPIVINNIIPNSSVISLNTHTNIVNKTNIVNNVNIPNVITNINDTNVNNINSKSGSDTELLKSGSNIENVEESDNEQCCVVIEPKRCHREQSQKVKCLHRAHHVCGAECSGNIESLIRVQPSTFPRYSGPRQYRIPVPYLVSIPNRVFVPRPYPVPVPVPQPISQPVTIRQPVPLPQPFPIQQMVPFQQPYLIQQRYAVAATVQQPCIEYQQNQMHWICGPDEPSRIVTSNKCYRQSDWPYLSCPQNMIFDCSRCLQRQCHPLCYS